MGQNLVEIQGNGKIREASIVAGIICASEERCKGRISLRLGYQITATALTEPEQGGERRLLFGRRPSIDKEPR
jgi:hypothetical protein